MTRFLTMGFMATFCVAAGIAMSSVGLWRHEIPYFFMGAFLAAIGALFCRAWHLIQVEAAVKAEKKHANGMRYKLADQAADIIAGIIKTAYPHLEPKKVLWGHDMELGMHTGIGIDIGDSPNGDAWAINIEALGRSEVWIYHSVGIDMKQSGTPQEWAAILPRLLARKKTRS